jgi:Flp pilus assembly protein TadG
MIEQDPHRTALETLETVARLVQVARQKVRAGDTVTAARVLALAYDEAMTVMAAQLSDPAGGTVVVDAGLARAEQILHRIYAKETR